MLQKLSISNYALIDSLEISFDSGLNILTGETGAGKSIILGALSLILGQRAESRYFFNQQKKCVIEGTFTIGDFDLGQFFTDNDIDYDGETVIRREISADGKSRAFINDTPVVLTTLKALGEKLIDIHSQHATLEINDPEFQLLVVDAVANHEEFLNHYRTKFRTYKKASAKLQQLVAESEKAKADLDYFEFQFDELDKANLLASEQEPLEQELYALNNAEEIKRNLSGAYNLMFEGEISAIMQLREAAHQLQTIEKFNADIAELQQRLNSSLIELKDIATEIEVIEQKTQTNEERAEEINNRLSLLYNLQKKHRVNSNEELIQLKNDLSGKIQLAMTNEDDIEKLRKEIKEAQIELEQMAEELSANRKKVIPEIEADVIVTLAEMGMGNAVLKIEQSEVRSRKSEVGSLTKQGGNNIPGIHLNENGADEIFFLFTANKGHKLSEMSKVASGGELSRLMLSIKSLIAKNTALPTIIFDEIDTGVSGEVANKVGQIMERLAKNLQVITITHLPQIASKGKSHYFVYKDDEGETTYTRLKQLNEQERVLEIAKMLSGDKPGESALQNARELLGA